MNSKGSRPCSSLQPGPQLLSHLLGKYKVGQCGLALEQAQRPLSLFRALLEPRKEGEMFLVSGATPCGAPVGGLFRGSGSHLPKVGHALG